MAIHARASHDLREFGARIPVRIGDPGASEPGPFVWGLVDSGARGTVIRRELADGLGLPIIGWRMVQTPTREDELAPEYDVALEFANGPRIELTALGLSLRGHSVQCLLGRDVLAFGFFVFDGQREQFTLAF